jgi:hypothetical protein
MTSGNPGINAGVRKLIMARALELICWLDNE